MKKAEKKDEVKEAQKMMANVFSQAIAGGGGEKKQEEVSELGPGCPVGKKYQVSKLSLEERFASIKLVGEECVKVRTC